MNRADEMAAKTETTERRLAGIAASSDHRLDEQLLGISPDDSQPTSSQQKPVEDLQNLLLRISHHLDYGHSERKIIYYRLQALDSQTKRIVEQTKRRPLRGFVRYLVAICIGVAAILAWQSYGEAAKKIIATKAPELGWSPETRQMIVSWIQELGWAKPPADTEKTAVRPLVVETRQASVAQTASEVAPKTPATSSLDPEQLHQLALDLTALRQVVEQLAARQDQIAGMITKLQAADQEILEKVPTPPPQPPAAPARKPKLVPLPSSRAPVQLQLR